MVLARLAEHLNLQLSRRPLTDEISSRDDNKIPASIVAEQCVNCDQQRALEEPRHAYPNAILAGGLGGLTGDMLMHSLDTVKTRQQGDPHRPSKYTSLASTYKIILRQEGVSKGLYGGVSPAALGSFIGTSIFFGSYEWSKRLMLDGGMTPTLAYLHAGLIADLIASPIYVPSEVLKTRLQLQGRHNNPFFNSGYNYRSLWNAANTIGKTEGVSALYHGFRATLYRDLPFSALQFAFYEKAREWAKWWVGSKQIGLSLEVLTGAVAGGLAGTITCPLDVFKTRIQTQVRTPIHETLASGSPPAMSASGAEKTTPRASQNPSINASTAASISSKQQGRTIAISPPSTTFARPGSVFLDTSSVVTGLKLIYNTEGLAGWFRGVGPRAVWTSIQSGAMFVLYQKLLSTFANSSLFPT